jgi:hypothetical protein
VRKGAAIPAFARGVLRKITKIIIRSRRNIVWDLNTRISRRAIGNVLLKETAIFPMMGAVLLSGGREAGRREICVSAFETIFTDSIGIFRRNE